MSFGFSELTVQAHTLVSAGDLAGAQQLLSDALSDADPNPVSASPELAELVGLQARVLIALGEPHSARGSAAFAYAAMTRLYGRADQRSIAAAATLAAVLHRVGSYPRAARLYQNVIIELSALDGPESLRVLAAHADLATVEYTRGRCSVARDRLQDAWELYREVYGDGHPSGIKMLARLGVMQRDCGRFDEAYESLILACELCRQYLPADDPLTAQVTMLTGAEADPDHVCADTGHPADGPVVPAARTPVPPETIGCLAGYPPPAPQPAGRAHPPTVPTPRLPPDLTVAPPVGDQTDTEPAEDDAAWWPPETTGEPVEATPARHPAGAAVPPPVVALAPAGNEPDGVRRVRPLPEPDHGSRLPVPVHHPSARRPRRLVSVAGAGVVVALLGTAAVIARVARVDEPRADPPPPVSSTTTPASPGAVTGPPTIAPGAPPAGLTLRDNRDNIALTWTYPPGAEGPVVISGGRAGQDLRAFREIPAGSTSYIIYELNSATDYCFTVAVVYSAETVGRAPKVCTRRR